MPAPVAGTAPRRPPAGLRSRAIRNLLRMGHCAPTVVKTLLDAAGEEAPWLVKLAAAHPGMGNTGNECGGITGPLVLLGLRHARDPSIADERNAFNRAMNRGHGLARWFAGRFGSTRCRELTGCDFDTVAGVHQYIESDCATRCGLMAREVETQVHRIV